MNRRWWSKQHQLLLGTAPPKRLSTEEIRRRVQLARTVFRKVSTTVASMDEEAAGAMTIRQIKAQVERHFPEEPYLANRTLILKAWQASERRRRSRQLRSQATKDALRKWSPSQD